VVALWKDPIRGAREIALESGAEGILLTVCAERRMRCSGDGRWPIENSPILYDVAVYQVHSGRAGALSSEAQPAMALGPPELGVQELTILTSWAEALAEALACAPDRVDAALSDARTGAPWRAMLGVEEPNSKLAEAIEILVREVRAALKEPRASLLEAVLTAVRDDRPGERELDALARRVLHAMLAARGDRIAIDKPTPET
jgi:hypothetical protein